MVKEAAMTALVKVAVLEVRVKFKAPVVVKPAIL